MSQKFYFDNLRLRMGAGGRFLVRLIIYIFYGMLVASTIVLIFTDLRWMQSLGVFFILFLVDRLLHINRAEKKISEMPGDGEVNLSYYLSPTTLGLLEKVIEKATFIGGDVFLWTAKQCLAQLDVRKMLMEKNVKWRDVESEVNSSLKSNLNKSLSKQSILLLIDKLVKLAAQNAIENKNDYIKPRDLYVAVERLRVRITE